MAYPKKLYRINSILAVIGGGGFTCIAIITVVESLSRTFFSVSSSWSLDLCTYFLLWAVFLSSPWAFQEKGHVAVDLLRDLIQKLFGIKPRRVMALVGYALVSFVLILLLGSAYRLASDAIYYSKLTTANLQIPAIYLDIGIIVGTVFMIITVVFIILDILSGSKKYL